MLIAFPLFFNEGEQRYARTSQSLPLPNFKGYDTIFEVYAEKFIKAGVSAICGCCGTVHEYTERIAKYRGCPVKTF